MNDIKKGMLEIMIEEGIKIIKTEISKPYREDQLYDISRRIFKMYDNVIELFKEQIKELKHINFLENNNNVSTIIGLVKKIRILENISK